MSPILNTANRLYVGTAQATRAYHGANLVWPSNIEYIASTNSGGTSFNLPSGILPNDIVLVASMDDSAASLNYPTGYVQGQRGRPNSTTYMWAYKRMGSPVDTTVSGLTNPTQGRHIAVVFRNVNTTTALDVSSPSVATGGTGTFVYPDYDLRMRLHIRTRRQQDGEGASLLGVLVRNCSGKGH
jgi:hypothetical protein